jgi:hypothetical protein
MDLHSIVAEPSAFTGREIAVEGFLMVSGDTRLVPDRDHPDACAILLPHPAIQQQLLSRVPAWGGGTHMYRESATVTGVLAEAPLRFVTVTKLLVRGDEGDIYEFDNVAC